MSPFVTNSLLPLHHNVPGLALNGIMEEEEILQLNRLRNAGGQSSPIATMAPVALTGNEKNSSALHQSYRGKHSLGSSRINTPTSCCLLSWGQRQDTAKETIRGSDPPGPATAAVATPILRGGWTLWPIATTFTCRVVIVFLLALCVGPSFGKDACEVTASSLAPKPHELIAERVSAGLDQSHCLDQCNMNGIKPNMCTCRASGQECRDEGDCCANLFFEEVRRPRLSCVPAFGRDLLAVVRCPESWSPASHVDETKSRCEDEKRKNLELSYLDDLPVLSLRSGVLYRNAYCASCNGDTRNLRPWELVLKCSHRDATEALKNGTATDIRYDSSRKGLQFYFGVKKRLAGCAIAIKEMQDPGFAEKLNVTQCNQRPLVMTCPEDYSNADVRVKCHSYASMVENTDTRILYRNLHCALCNGVSPKDLRCHSIAQLGPDTADPLYAGPSYAIVVDLPHSSMGAPYVIIMEFSNWQAAALPEAPMKNVCGRDELHDPVSNDCVKCGCPADVCVKRDDCHWTRVTNDKVHVREDSLLVINSSSEELEPDRWHRDGLKRRDGLRVNDGRRHSVKASGIRRRVINNTAAYIRGVPYPARNRVRVAAETENWACKTRTFPRPFSSGGPRFVRRRRASFDTWLYFLPRVFGCVPR
ncbi:hypothetical protein HPB48_015693 [Haemaphysalis longicornis]|uniref:SMB domain-containing protein n=1 Tax=Haemaphysalis longicornis TaxID=44386 RepID=A0A9J6FQ16_HAELO|nr:hypothetical protein HPB48_015693 [Haemaphysalis longicornis]